MASNRTLARNIYLSWVGKDDLDALEPRPPKCEHGQFEERDSPWWPPGTPWVRPPGATERLVNLGPTLTALFHPKSWFCNFVLRWPKPGEPDKLDRVFLLHLPGDDVAGLEEAIFKIAEHRLSKNSDLSKEERKALKDVLSKRGGPLQFVRIEARHTQHKELAEGIRRWVDSEEDPLELSDDKKKKNVFINLSPGTGAMHATWLLLYGNRDLFPGIVREDKIDVTFVEGDGGYRTAHYSSDDEREPIVELPFDPFRLVPESGKTDEKPRSELKLGSLKSKVYKDLARQLRMAAQMRVPVVLVGERGTGKTMLAKYYHEVAQAMRSEQPDEDTSRSRKSGRAEPSQDIYDNFSVVSLSEFDSVELLRSELFGWKEGSFTDAKEDYYGLLGNANGGTLFLDEVHHLPRSLQAALLRPLNDGTYQRRGDRKTYRSDFDLVTATNRCNDWESYLYDDFLDRIKGVVLRVPSFAEVFEYGNEGFEDLQAMFGHVLQQQCHRSRVKHEEPPDWFWRTFHHLLERLPKEKRLPGNWRDLYFLVRHLLLHCTEPYAMTRRILSWDNKKQITRALEESLGIVVLGEGA